MTFIAFYDFAHRVIVERTVIIAFEHSLKRRFKDSVPLHNHWTLSLSIALLRDFQDVVDIEAVALVWWLLGHSRLFLVATSPPALILQVFVVMTFLTCQDCTFAV